MAHRPDFHRTIKNKRSFTLLETIVAIYIITVGLGAAMSLAQLSLSSASVFKQQLIATNLAEEGAELVHNKRDSNYLEFLNNSDNSKGILNAPGNCNSANGCRINWNSAADVQNPSIAFANCPAACPPLRRAPDNDPDAGLYGYNGSWVQTNFVRTIFVDSTGLTNGFRVRSVLDWTDKFGPKQVVVESYLTDHHY